MRELTAYRPSSASLIRAAAAPALAHVGRLLAVLPLNGACSKAPPRRSLVGIPGPESPDGRKHLAAFDVPHAALAATRNVNSTTDTLIAGNATARLDPETPSPTTTHAARRGSR